MIFKLIFVKLLFPSKMRWLKIWNNLISVEKIYFDIRNFKYFSLQKIKKLWENFQSGLKAEDIWVKDSRMGKVKFVEDSLLKLWSDIVCLTS